MKLGRQTVQYGFAATSALLVVLLAYEITAPLPDFEPPSFRLKPKAQPVAGVVAVTTPPFEAFAEIAARPPFDPSRKGLAAAASSDASSSPPDVTLIGVILDKENSLALLKSPTTPLATAYRVGATISGWQVAEISPDRVVLSAGPARAELRLDANKAAPHPPAVASSNSQ